MVKIHSFKKSENKLSDLYEYVSIAMDLKVYDFAAHLFWISATYDKTKDDATFKFLYCIEQLDITSLKSNFKGDFKKEFKKIMSKACLTMIWRPCEVEGGAACKVARGLLLCC